MPPPPTHARTPTKTPPPPPKKKPTGAALGTGSAIAHRAVDSMMGPRTMHVESSEAAAAAPPAQQYGAPAPTSNACAEQAKQFAECMSRTGDMPSCQFYFDAMQQCKLGAGAGYA